MQEENDDDNEIARDRCHTADVAAPIDVRVSKRDFPETLHRPSDASVRTTEASFLQVSEANVDDMDEYGTVAALEMGGESPVIEPAFGVEASTTNGIQEERSPSQISSEELQEPTPIDYSNSHTAPHRSKGMTCENVKDIGVYKMHKFSLYETQTRYYLVGGDILDADFRILKIDRTSAPGELSIIDDEIIYAKKDAKVLLDAIDDGNRAAGGMRLKGIMWGILGFIKFTGSYYMLIVTKRKQVAVIGGHFIYEISGTELLPLNLSQSSRHKTNTDQEETRYLSILNSLDLNRSFYFSYSYNITRTLQHNTIRQSTSAPISNNKVMADDFNRMFVWNHHLLKPALHALTNPYDWCLPIIHGFVDQSAINIFGHSVYVTVIARRSRFFAGARFLKRGINDKGFVANDVETEQIVADKMFTPLRSASDRLLDSSGYTSFVQHRGSIPLYWTQDNSGVSPKPDIKSEPFHSDAREHLPLRESKLLDEYQNAIYYLNQALPPDKKILYEAYDMARAAKTRGQDVIGALERIANKVVSKTGFFHIGNDREAKSAVQSGVVRTNCVDCLDRTNACQFVIGKRALAGQLQALGIIIEDSLNYDSDAVNIFAHMFNDHGDTLASQYGGSHLVNTTDSYRKINSWQSHSRDMLESFKRFYHNSFFDNQRQEAYNLFLGNFVYVEGQPMLWELPNDYYLHHAYPMNTSKHRRHYFNWFTPEYLERRTLPSVTSVKEMPSVTDEWWREYYQPQLLSTFLKTFDYRMSSTKRYLPKPNSSPSVDQSPFNVRKHSQEESPVLKTPIEDPESREVLSPLPPSATPHKISNRISSLQQWLHPPGQETGQPANGSSFEHSGRALVTPQLPIGFVPADKAHMNQWSLSQFYINSLHPSVSEKEALVYEKYLSPAELDLVGAASLDRRTPMEYFSHTNHEDGAVNGMTQEAQNWMRVDREPLNVTEDDLERKRYQAYRKYARGKSLFKQSKIDSEFRDISVS